MARHRRIGREDLAKAILAAARAAVDAQGLQALNARALAEAAGCSVGMIYNVYPGGLDQLARTLNGETLDELHEAFLQAAAAEQPGGSGPEARLLALADAYIGFAERHTHRWQAVFGHRPADGSTAPPWFVEKVERLAGFGADLLAPLCRGGPAAARRSASVLWAGVHGICDLALSDKLGRVSGEPPRELARDLVRRYLAGLEEGSVPGAG